MHTIQGTFVICTEALAAVDMQGCTCSWRFAAMYRASLLMCITEQKPPGTASCTPCACCQCGSQQCLRRRRLLCWSCSSLSHNPISSCFASRCAAGGIPRLTQLHVGSTRACWPQQTMQQCLLQQSHSTACRLELQVLCHGVDVLDKTRGALYR